MLCPQCGETIPDNPSKCAFCGHEFASPMHSAHPDATRPPGFIGIELILWTLITLAVFSAFILDQPTILIGVIIGYLALFWSLIKKKRLVELSILIVFTLIFLAIGIPNCIPSEMEANIRGSKRDLRKLAAAIEAYKSDNFVAPSFKYLPSGRPTFAGINLTTPIAYLSDLNLRDYLSAVENPSDFSYCYYASPGGKDWIVWSAGPDWKYQITSATVASVLSIAPNFREARANTTYDPSNGMRSSGDIWRSSNGGAPVLDENYFTSKNLNNSAKKE